MAQFMIDRINKIIGSIRANLKNTIVEGLPNSATLQTLFLVMAVTIISYEVVSIFYKLISISLVNSAAITEHMAVKKQVTAAGMRNPLPSYRVIVERNLFASTLQAAGEKQPGKGIFGSGPEASAFELKGTVAGDTGFGFAVMEERGKDKQKLFRLGDLVGSARLVKITRFTATLRDGTRDLTLKIKETPEKPLFSRSPGAGANFGPAFPTTDINLSRREIQEKLSDLQAIMSQAAVRPSFVAGAHEGFLIYNIKPGSLYSKLGLHNGDVILDVNGKSIQSANDFLQLVNVMQTGGDILLNLKRGGKKQAINYTFR